MPYRVRRYEMTDEVETAEMGKAIKQWEVFLAMAETQRIKAVLVVLQKEDNQDDFAIIQEAYT